MGRKSANEGVVVGVDIGGTKTALLLVDRQTGQELARDRFSTPHDQGPEAVLAELRKGVDGLLTRAGRPVDRLQAIGVAVPGQVDDKGRVIDAGNLEGWSDLALGDRLNEIFEIPTFVEHDANAGALGERWRGCARRLNDFVFLALGTGLGAGIVIEGRLHRGAHHAAGEVGSLVPGRRQLGHQSKGQHLGELAGGRSIRDQAHEAVGHKMSAAQAIQRAAFDERLEPLADEVADHVSLVVLALATIVDPEAIVVGGGTASAGEELLERVRARVEPSLMAPLRLVRSALGEDAQAFGAVWGALDRLGQVPEVAEPAGACKEQI